MRTSYDIVTIRERKFRQLKGEGKKNTDYCFCHREETIIVSYDKFTIVLTIRTE